MKFGNHITAIVNGETVTGHIVGHSLDGLTVQTTDGRIRSVPPALATVIPAPTPTDPTPLQRTVQRPIQTSHEPPVQPAIVQNPHNLPVLVSGKWSDPQ